MPEITLKPQFKTTARSTCHFLVSSRTRYLPEGRVLEAIGISFSPGKGSKNCSRIKLPSLAQSVSLIWSLSVTFSRMEKSARAGLGSSSMLTKGKGPPEGSTSSTLLLRLTSKLRLIRLHSDLRLRHRLHFLDLIVYYVARFIHETSCYNCDVNFF